MPAAHPEPADLLTPRQRWIAARRLAADDTDRVAASAAGVSVHDLRDALGADPEFALLVDDFRAIKARPAEERRARLADLCLDGAERAILDGRVSTLNQCVRALDVLGDGEGAAEEEDGGYDDDDWDSIDEMVEGAVAFRRTLSPEDRAEYDALCVRAGVRAAELRFEREAALGRDGTETAAA